MSDGWRDLWIYLIRVNMTAEATFESAPNADLKRKDNEQTKK
jgi:hypothetical protein